MPDNSWKIVREQLVYALLLPLWFVLHGNNENFGLLPWETGALLFLKYLFITAIFFAFGFFVVRNKSRSLIACCILFTVYFLFGYFHDFIKQLWPGSTISSYSFLLPFLFVVTIILLILIRKNRSPLTGFNKYLRYLIILLIGIECFFLAFNLITNKKKANVLINHHTELISADSCRQPQPDIFFIVLDEYPSSSSLKNDLGFDNSAFDSLLVNNGFYISGKSESNYNITPFSIGSTLGLDYLRDDVAENKFGAKEFIQAMETFRQNPLVPFLEKRGYDIVNVGCFNIAGYKTEVSSYFENWYPEQIDNMTLAGRFTRDIMWNFTLKNIFTGKFTLPEGYMKGKKKHIERNQYNLKRLQEELQRSSEKPKFVYSHLMLPHEPFFLKEDGSFQNDTLVVKNGLDYKAAFIQQVKYTNRLMEKIIPLFMKRSSPHGTVVILEGDHGYKFFSDSSALGSELKNLNAYYFSDRNYKMLYDSISPVNSFRVVLNKYFCGNLPLLKDKKNYLHEQK